MSGITPILDTLLHQVLGRRATFVRRALLDRPISPPQSAQPTEKAHSDSRLNPRPLLSSTRSGVVGKAKVAAQAAEQGAASSSSSSEAAVTSRFSKAARTIADILARFPAPPSAVRPSAPLLHAGSTVHASILATLLRESIESSGLFYEAHLRRWHRGTYPRARLLREPQMRWLSQGASRNVPAWAQGTASAGNAQDPAKAAAQARAGMNTPIPDSDASAQHASGTQGTATPTRADIGDPLAYGSDGKPLLGKPALAADVGEAARSGLNDKLSSVLTASDKTGHTGLETTVRHQLEMLAAPMLRWEGQPWAGLFMALQLQPPPQHAQSQQPQEDQAGAHDDEQSVWKSRLTLRLAHLGEIRLDLHLGTTRLALDMRAEPQAAKQLAADKDRLRDRLSALGFQKVDLHVGAQRKGEDGSDG